MSSKDLGTGTTVTRAKEDANEWGREQIFPQSGRDCRPRLPSTYPGLKVRERSTT